MSAPSRLVEPQAKRLSAQRTGFRVDIQGLRGVAVLAVVLYHCGLGFVGGGYVGVDVFFVISGFLITSHLFKELQTTGRISVPAFYARRVRRLLVPAVLVIIVTVALAWRFGPKLSAADTAKDGAFASVYFINYHLAALAVDYQHAGDAASPLQHYWSLAVEEQFYLIWPLLMLTTVWVFHRWNRRRVVGVLVAVAIAASLALSIEMTPRAASLAYFSLQTRAWQLGIGAAIAIGLPLVRRLPAIPASVATWLGLGLIVGSACGFDNDTPFPGYLALVPVGGAALVIAGGSAAAKPRSGATLLLRRQPLQFFGMVSYAWYLWHWPAVTLGPYILGRSVGSVGKVVLCLVALGLAWLTLKLVEQPVLRTRAVPVRWLPLGAFASAAAITVSLLAYYVSPLHVDGPPAPTVALGARPANELRSLVQHALTNQRVPRNLSPGLVDAQTDGRSACMTQLTATSVSRCTYGDPDAAHTVVLFGDSHADQWTPALRDLAVAAGWRLVTLTRVGCPLADYLIYVDQLRRNYTECSDWRAGRVAEIAHVHPDLVVVSQSNTIGSSAYTDQQWAAGTAATVAKLTGSSGRVVYLGDTPHPPVNIPACLAAHLRSSSKCNFTDPTVLGADAPNAVQAVRAVTIARAIRATGASYLETSPWFCSAGACPPIVGNVLLYRDDSHISSRAAQLLEPLLRPVLFPAS